MNDALSCTIHTQVEMQTHERTVEKLGCGVAQVGNEVTHNFELLRIESPTHILKQTLLPYST